MARLLLVGSSVDLAEPQGEKGHLFLPWQGSLMAQLCNGLCDNNLQSSPPSLLAPSPTQEPRAPA